MKKLVTTIFAACVVLLSFAAKAQDQAAAMKSWEDFMTPGPIHKMLAKGEGKWTTETSMWMSADSPPMSSKGTCTTKMIMGGRYRQTTFSGDFMGKPFEGMATLAYDNAKKTFFSTWIDNMGTGIMMMTGTWDDATKTMTSTGTETDPMTGKDIPVREVFKVIDDNHQEMEMYMMENGKEMKTMEMKLARVVSKK